MKIIKGETSEPLLLPDHEDYTYIPKYHKSAERNPWPEIKKLMLRVEARRAKNALVS